MEFLSLCLRTQPDGTIQEIHPLPFRTGDYSAAMVGARSDTWMPTAADVGAVPSGAVRAIQTMTQTEYDALTQKDPATLYLIKE